MSLTPSASGKELNTTTTTNNNNNNASNSANPVPEAKKEKIVHKLKAGECPVHSVTVYNDRAEIIRSVTAQLKEDGTHEVVIGDLSPDVDAESIRIYGGEGNATILEVSHQEVFGDREDLDQTALLFKRIEAIRLDKLRLTNSVDSNKKERAWLEGFAETLRKGGSQANNAPLSLGELKVDEIISNASSFLKYYSEQIARLDGQDNSASEEIKNLTAQETTIKKQIAQLQQQHLLAFRREVSVVINAPAATKVDMQLCYIIMNAKWTASYDARMSYESEELEVTYFGSITNASGEDWNNVRLYLSTAAPSIGGQPPPLRFLRIEADYGQARHDNHRFVSQKKITDTRAQKAIDQISTNIDTDMNFDDYMKNALELQTEALEYHKESIQQKRGGRSFKPKLNTKTGEGSMTVMTAFAETSHIGSSNATFEIPRGSTIVSDNKPHKVTIAVIRLKARLSYYATPDTSGHVYMKATATNTTEQYPFLAGPVNVFMNANFISKSELPDVSPQEKFSVFLGADSGVRLEVKPVRRVKEKQSGIINKSNTESFRHSAIIKNTRKTKINISVLCQVPTSNDERIKVKLIRPDMKQDNSVKFLENKLLKWKLVIQPNHQEELAYHYTVEWPASLNVVHMAAQY